MTAVVCGATASYQRTGGGPDKQNQPRTKGNEMESQRHSCSTQKRLSTLLPQTASPCRSGCPEELLDEMWNPRNGKSMPVTSAAHGQTHIAVGALKEIHIDHVLVRALTAGMRMRDSAWIRPRKCIPTTDSPNEFGQWWLLLTVKLDSTQIFWNPSFWPRIWKAAGTPRLYPPGLCYGKNTAWRGGRSEMKWEQETGRDFVFARLSHPHLCNACLAW